MSCYANTETAANLLKAFEAECKANNKYLLFASRAKKEGYEQIGELFRLLAGNEKEHAKVWYKELFGVCDTKECLKEAIEAENHEWIEMYKRFAEVAEAENFPELAEKFRMTAEVEKSHEEHFKMALKQLEGDLYDMTDDGIWVCRNCGHIVFANEPPEKCQLCNHPKGFFERKGEICK